MLRAKEIIVVPPMKSDSNNKRKKSSQQNLESKVKKIVYCLVFFQRLSLYYILKGIQNGKKKPWLNQLCLVYLFQFLSFVCSHFSKSLPVLYTAFHSLVPVCPDQVSFTVVLTCRLTPINTVLHSSDTTIS